jgi:hypothetical protein
MHTLLDMTTQPAARQGDAPPRQLELRWRRTQRLRDAATRVRQSVTPRQRRDALNAHASAAADLWRAAISRHIRAGNDALVVAAIAQLVAATTDIDRRTP